MEEEPLSFTKKPFLPNIQTRHSSINFASFPSEVEDVDSIHDKLQRQLQEAQVSKKTELNNDDPGLDHDEQIRAPKFQQLSRSKSQVIGEMDDSFVSSHCSITPGTSASTNGKSSEITYVNEEVEMTDISDNQMVKSTSDLINKNKKKYQPADFAIKRSASLSETHERGKIGSTNIEGPILSTLEDYNFEFSNANMSTRTTYPMNYISNLEYTTTTPQTTNTVTRSRESSTNSISSISRTSRTSPFSTLQSSSESMQYQPSKQKHYTNLAPIRTIDDPRTPNYKPCVLRITSDLLPAEPDHYASGTYVSNFDDFSSITKAHWIPNHHRLSCHNCSGLFGLMNRRHHCRKCGEIFCSACVSLDAGVKLTYDAQFDVFNGTKVKCCNKCGKNWNTYLEKNDYGGLGNSGDHHQQQLISKTTSTTRLNGVRVGVQVGDEIDLLDSRPPSKDGVVPADWTWSSF